MYFGDSTLHRHSQEAMKAVLTGMRQSCRYNFMERFDVCASKKIFKLTFYLSRCHFQNIFLCQSCLTISQGEKKSESEGDTKPTIISVQFIAGCLL